MYIYIYIYDITSILFTGNDKILLELLIICIELTILKKFGFVVYTKNNKKHKRLRVIENSFDFLSNFILSTC